MGRNYYDFSNLGEEIRDSVKSALNHGDFSGFSHLNEEVQHTVDAALDELKKSQWYEESQKKEQKQQKQNVHSEDTAGSTANGTTNNSSYSTVNSGANRQSHYAYDKVVTRDFRAPAVPVRQVGKVGGILFTVFGSIALGIGTILLLIFLTVGSVSAEAAMFTLAMSLGLPITAAGSIMLGVGRHKSKRLRRLDTYLKQIGKKGYCEIKELAKNTGCSTRFLVKDLRRMIRLGIFPEGHMDDKKTTFMLDNKTHQMYLDMMKSKVEAEKIEEQSTDSGKSGSEQVKSVIREGNEYIIQIRQANAAIPGPEISVKLDRLSNVMDKIFRYVEEHPEKIDDLHKFMEYYLPTTLKLVDAYREFDAQTVQGENITSAKKEIEATLDTINQAFEQLFDNLYAEAAMDISTDIDVLQTMFAQEGLTGNKFGQ